jgi:hypothetical protein
VRLSVYGDKGANGAAALLRIISFSRVQGLYLQNFMPKKLICFKDVLIKKQ